jgi:hypothetical protein
MNVSSEPSQAEDPDEQEVQEAVAAAYAVRASVRYQLVLE